MKTTTLLAAILAATSALRAGDKVPTLPETVEIFTVQTRSEENKEVPFYVRRPSGYDPSAKGRTYRILLICPVLGGDGLTSIERHGLMVLADSRGWFLVSPTFKQEISGVRDRKTCYYYPEAFSGKAVLDALDLIAKKYPVDVHHLLLKGLSGGAQFVHRFALWAPDRVTAVATNSSSWFDEPNPNAAKVAWLVTIGDSDPSYNASLEFVSKLRDCGASPLFRSYPGLAHKGDKRVLDLEAAFLTFHDKLTAGNLGRRGEEKNKPKWALAGKKMPYVGDAQDWRYFPNTEVNRENVSEDSRIFLPSEEIARLWGKQENE